jgi:hypothetical protein
MAPTFSSLGDGSGLKGSNPPGGASYARAGTHASDSFMLSGAKMATNDLKLKVSVPFTADDKVNPIPAVSMLLKTAQLFDPKAHIKSMDPTCSPIENISNIAKLGQNIEKYVMDLQTNVIKKQFAYFIVLETNTRFHNLKFNKEMFAWLREKNHWITLHTMTTNFTSPIGFILGMHPTLSSCDAMKELLDGVLPDIEFNLIMISQFYITPQGTKVNTNVVELHVAADEASRACENLSKAWLDTQFVEELDNCSVGMPMEFIPMIKKGVMEVSTFQECLHHQTEFAKSTIAISVDGIGGLEVEVMRQGISTSLAQLVKKLKSDKGKALFSGIELTKYTGESGRYPFLTQKNVIDEAEKKLDNLFETLAKERLLDTFGIEGMCICCINQVQSKAVSAYAGSLKARFQPPVAEVQAPTRPALPPTRNAWKRIPSLTNDHENFPELNSSPARCHKDKKQHTENGSNESTADDVSLSPPLIGTNQTELTDERTEIVAHLQDTFMKQLQSIKDANKTKVKNTEARINQAEAAYNSAQQTILGEFQTITDKYTTVLDSFSCLSTDFHSAKLVQDKRHLATQQQIGTMMQLLLSITTVLPPARERKSLRKTKSVASWNLHNRQHKNKGLEFLVAIPNAAQPLKM